MIKNDITKLKLKHIFDKIIKENTNIFMDDDYDLFMRFDDGPTYITFSDSSDDKTFDSIEVTRLIYNEYTDEYIDVEDYVIYDLSDKAEFIRTINITIKNLIARRAKQTEKSLMNEIDKI